MDAALLQAQKVNKRVEIESLRSESATYYANPDGATVTAELSSTLVRVKKGGVWQPFDPTLVEEGGVLRPKAVKGDLTLSLGGDTAAVTYTADTGKGTISAPSLLPKPVFKGNVATYPQAYGPGIDLVITVTPSGFRHEIVLRQRPAKSLKLRIPLKLPKGLALGEGSDETLGVLDSKGREIADMAATPMLDATEMRAPATGRMSTAKASVDRDGALVLAPDTAFLTDPSVAYPVTLAAPLEDWTGTGIAGDTFVSHSYPSSLNNKGLNRIIVGRSNSGTVTWHGYVRFNIKGTPLEGGTVDNADLRLYNYDTNDCSDTATAGITARRVTSSWDINTMTWSNQPSVTVSGQIGNKGAYGVDCPEGEGELYYSIEQITQAWMDGAADYGVQLSSSSESVPTNWRWYRSDEYGGYDTWPFTPRGPVLIIKYEPLKLYTGMKTLTQTRDPSAAEFDALPDASGNATPSIPSTPTAEEGEEADQQSPWTVPVELEDISSPPGATAEEIEAIKNGRGLMPGLPDGWTPPSKSDITPPVITTTSPASNAKDVPSDTSVAISFSEPVSGAQVTLKDPTGIEIPGSTATANNSTWTFKPGNALSRGLTYTADVSNAADAAGNIMTPYSWSFATEGDTTPPSIVETKPAADATDVPLTSAIIATFSEPTSDVLITLKDSAGTSVPGNVTVDVSSKVWTFAPATRLMSQTVYNVETRNGKDSLGNVMTPHVWSFVTKQLDTTAPSVIDTTPAKDAVGAELGGPIRATFSEPTVNGQVTVRDAAGTMVEGTVTRESATVISFLPTSPLEGENTYTSEVSNAQDEAGNIMSPFSWSFTTKTTPPDPNGPVALYEYAKPAKDDEGLVTSSLTPTFGARMYAPYGSSTMALTVQVEHDPQAPDQGSGLIWSGTSPIVASQEYAYIGVPDGKLSDGWKLRWRARATSNGVNGTWTDWHQLTVDVAKPEVLYEYASPTSDEEDMVTSSLTPTFGAMMYHPNGQPSIAMTVEVEHDPQAPDQGSGLIWSGTSPIVASQEYAYIDVP
ncbi:Ig-like domain-containing protein, partial [Nonomuraea sp. NPDC047529]|uniref:Ig-like domain-containing protein n=1 Tax=Nonomuraea sp. NPDC047529 TaxID=3155623 RepID=UPI0033DC4B72